MTGKVLAIVCALVLSGSPYAFSGGTFDFNGLDSNGDGKIDLNELNSFIQKEIPEGFALLDKNGDGFVDKEELQAVFADFFDFDRIDADKDGKIALDELTAFIVNLLSAKFGLSDLNNDAFLDADEFKAAQAPPPWAQIPPMKTFLGKVVSINKHAKAMVVRVWVEGEIFPSGGGMIPEEHLVDKKNIRFDISQARSEGNGPRRNDTVQVIYDKDGDNYIAYDILKIEKKE